MSSISNISVSTGAAQTVTDATSDGYDPQLRMAALNLSIVSLVDQQLQDQIGEQERSNERATLLADLRRQANAWKKALGDGSTALKDTDVYKSALKPSSDDKAAKASSRILLDQIDAYLNSGKSASAINLKGKEPALQMVLNYVDYLNKPNGKTPVAGLASLLQDQALLRGDSATSAFCQKIIEGHASVDEVNSSMLLSATTKKALVMLMSPDLRAEVSAQLTSIRAEAQAALEAPIPPQDSFSALADQWRELARSNPNLKLDPGFADQIAKGELKAADIDTMTADLDTAFRNETTRSQEVQLEISRLQNLIKSKSEEFYNLVKSDTDMKQRIAGR